MLISHNRGLLYEKNVRGVIVIPDYEKMYKQMVNAAEDAIKILIEAQRNCEEMYIEDADRQEHFANTGEKCSLQEKER